MFKKGSHEGISTRYSRKKPKMNMRSEILEISSKIVLFRNIKHFYMSNLTLYCMIIDLSKTKKNTDFKILLV